MLKPKRYTMLMGVNDQIRETARAAFKAQGLTQKRLAKKVGLTQPAVGRLLKGDRKGDPDTWQRLLDALGLKLVAVPKENDQDPVEYEVKEA
jgi:transcriptional regulator with XRE-family HTH domain